MCWTASIVLFLQLQSYRSAKKTSIVVLSSMRKDLLFEIHDILEVRIVLKCYRLICCQRFHSAQRRIDLQFVSDTVSSACEWKFIFIYCDGVVPYDNNAVHTRCLRLEFAVLFWTQRCQQGSPVKDVRVVFQVVHTR